MAQPTLRSDCITLRPWLPSDLDFVLSVASDPMILLISEVPSEPDPDRASAFIAAQRERVAAGHGWAWASCTPDGTVVGYVGALWIAPSAGRVSIGYWTRRTERRAGATTEAVTTAADWLLADGGVARLEAFNEPRRYVGDVRRVEASPSSQGGEKRATYARARGRGSSQY